MAKKLERPDNPDLPYFAYDAFKPKQVAFPVIEHFVDHIEPFELDYYELRNRNGMPMVVDDSSTAPIKGYLIYFNDNIVDVYNYHEKSHEEYDAYDYIRKTKPPSLFEWRQEPFEGGEFNITLGQEKKYGDHYENNTGNYDGKADPTFSILLDFIEGNIESMKIESDLPSLYKLQMNYMLLWSSIDKYLALCNGGWFQHNNVVEWAKWKEFKLGFEDVDRFHKVRSSNTNKICRLNPNKSISSAEYYYQLRCNIIHSSKRDITDVSFLKLSLNELLGIFRTALDLSFNPKRYGKYNLSNW